MMHRVRSFCDLRTINTVLHSLRVDTVDGVVMDDVGTAVRAAVDTHQIAFDVDIQKLLDMADRCRSVFDLFSEAANVKCDFQENANVSIFTVCVHISHHIIYNIFFW